MNLDTVERSRGTVMAVVAVRLHGPLDIAMV